MLFAASYCLYNGIYYIGSDLATFDFVPSASHCQYECQAIDACQFFTFTINNGKCYLKTSNASGANNLAISGPKFCISHQGKCE
jgi:hypothetical protein